MSKRVLLSLIANFPRAASTFSLRGLGFVGDLRYDYTFEAEDYFRSSRLNEHPQSPPLRLMSLIVCKVMSLEPLDYEVETFNLKSLKFWTSKKYYHGNFNLDFPLIRWEMKEKVFQLFTAL